MPGIYASLLEHERDRCSRITWAVPGDTSAGFFQRPARTVLVELEAGHAVTIARVIVERIGAVELPHGWPTRMIVDVDDVVVPAR
ncbi:hypothetical protein AWC31_14840 [Mycolicibacterium wolinskyi]|uniref:Uncharacterized protein n=2 Tax=Mycobacteriaceae TaxID=1762 RepID=A0A1X2FHC5_9MYCO|nr:hypothetical protein AWC31_14840 [Mycolicibacterium wolinskyi]